MMMIEREIDDILKVPVNVTRKHSWVNENKEIQIKVQHVEFY